MIVTLDQPPLAASGQRAHDARRPGSRAAERPLRFVACLPRRARTPPDGAVAKLRRAIPQATVGRRLKIILDGLTVTLPVMQLPKLYKLGLARRVYPSARFEMNLDDSPSLIGATAFINRTGANGEGTKIAVVDDGVDQASTFFDAEGLRVPAGLPARAGGVHHAEGDRRARLPWARLGEARPAATRPQGVLPRHARRRDRRGQRGDDRAGRPRPPPKSKASRASRRARGSATIGYSTRRRRSGTAPSRRRSSRRSRTRSPTGWT